MPLLTLKSANGLKTIYIDTFDKVLDLVDQKYHFLETFDNKTQMGEGAKLATVNFQMDNFSTRKLDGAKPYIINQNGTNLATPLS